MIFELDPQIFGFINTLNQIYIQSIEIKVSSQCVLKMTKKNHEIRSHNSHGLANYIKLVKFRNCYINYAAISLSYASDDYARRVEFLLIAYDINKHPACIELGS